MHCLAIKNKGKIYLVIPNDGIFVSHIVFFECSLCVFSSFFYFCHGQWCNLMPCCMRLVKGNPVKVRSYTRSCMFCMSGVGRRRTGTSQKTCLVRYVLYKASGKGFL